MISTLGDIYTDILVRAGAGYASLEDRARELFWRNVGILVKAREFNPIDVAGITTVSEIEVEYIQFPYNTMSNITNHILDVEAILIPGAPHDAIITYIEPGLYALAKSSRNYLNNKTGIAEVLWTANKGIIELTYDAYNPAFSNGYVFVKRTAYTVSNASTTKSAASTPYSTFFSYPFVAKVIELATQALTQEIKG